MVFGKKMGFLAAAVMVAATTLSASAASVDFTTTGVFATGGGTSLTEGGITLTFYGATETGLDTPSITSFGELTTTGTGGSLNDFNGQQFTLTVNQTLPGPGGSQNFGKATITGTILANSSSAILTFSSPIDLTFSGSVPAVTYSIISADNGPRGTLGLKKAGLGITNDNTSTIQGRVTAVPLPDAAGMGLVTLAGLGALAAFRKRSKIA